MKVSVVIAAYDEGANLARLLPRLHASLTQVVTLDPDVLLVLAGSDDSVDCVARMQEHGMSYLRFLREEKPGGLGLAFRRGFDAVPDDADLVLTMDADLNHRPEEIPFLLAALTEHSADIVIGSRYIARGVVEGLPAWKLALSRAMNLFMSLLYGLPVRDKTSGFRLYRASALRRLRFRNRDFAFLPELLIRAQQARLHMVEVPINFSARDEGRSKMRFWKTVGSYVRLFASRFHD